MSRLITLPIWIKGFAHCALILHSSLPLTRRGRKEQKTNYFRFSVRNGSWSPSDILLKACVVLFPASCVLSSPSHHFQFLFPTCLQLICWHVVWREPLATCPVPANICRDGSSIKQGGMSNQRQPENLCWVLVPIFLVPDTSGPHSLQLVGLHPLSILGNILFRLQIENSINYVSQFLSS